MPNKSPYTAEVYRGYIEKWLLPMWGKFSLSDVKAVAFESWLGTMERANGTRAKVRNIMSAIYKHGMRWEFIDHNPISLVRQSATRQNAPCVLGIDEIRALLSELTGMYHVMVFVAVTTGLRISELLGLQWQDCDFLTGEIRLSRGIVRQRQTSMKNEASRKPVPLDDGLANVLTEWRFHCAYNQPADYLFASVEKAGKQPIWPNSAMEKHIRPAAIRAKIEKRIGWHTFRHSFGTLVKSLGADVATTQALMRHSSSSVTMDRYVQAITLAKRQAQDAILSLLDPNGPSRGVGIRVTAVSQSCGECSGTFGHHHRSLINNWAGKLDPQTDPSERVGRTRLSIPNYNFFMVPAFPRTFSMATNFKIPRLRLARTSTISSHIGRTMSAIIPDGTMMVWIFPECSSKSLI